MSRLTPEAREELVKQRRAQLLDAALRLMTERGFAGTAIEDVAREAGVAKGTVYLYFPTKDALFEALLDTQSLLPELTSLLGALPLESDLETIVKHAVPVLWNALSTRKRVVGLLLHEGGMRTAFGPAFLQRMLPVSETLAQRLAERIGEPRSRQIDAFVAIRALLWMMLGLFVEQEIAGGAKIRPIEDRALTDTISELFLHGVLGTPRNEAP